MRSLLLGFAIGVLFALAGCHGRQAADIESRHFTYLIDATASIVPSSLDQAMQAIESASMQLRRGDCISVIPIIGQSIATPSDEIVRRCMPRDRQPYDHDMREFQVELHSSLNAEEHRLILHRAAKTDILGTLDLAAQEFALDGPHVQRTLIILSDFIQEDELRNFITSPDLGSPETAKRLARNLAGASACKSDKRACDWSGMRVFLGNLQSSETPTLSPERREAIQRFWVEYFTACNSHVFFATDGPGMVSRFLFPVN